MHCVLLLSLAATNIPCAVPLSFVSHCILICLAQALYSMMAMPKNARGLWEVAAVRAPACIECRSWIWIARTDARPPSQSQNHRAGYLISRIDLRIMVTRTMLLPNKSRARRALPPSLAADGLERLDSSTATQHLLGRLRNASQLSQCC